MNLYEIRQNGNRYCGPSAISAIAGIGTAEAATLIRQMTGRRWVRSTSTAQVEFALCRLGFSTAGGPVEKTTLRRWVRANCRGADVWLVVAGNHWIVAQGRQTICGIVKVMVHVEDHPYRLRRVTEAYKVTKVAPVTLPTVLPPSQTAHQKAEARARTRCKALALRHGIRIEPDRYGDRMHYWVLPPSGLYATEADDPFDGSHLCAYWTEALEVCEAYANAVEEKNTESV